MKTRNREIDIMKGLLTLAMVLCHCIQFFGHEDHGIQKFLVDFINLTTFSGFLFCFGYVGNLAYYQKDMKAGIKKMGINVLRMLVAFYISGIAFMAFVEQKIFRMDLVLEVLKLNKYPGWSEFLASFAAVLFVGILLFPLFKKMNGWMFLVMGVISIVACFLPYDRIQHPWAALFVGSTGYITFPVLQYGVYYAAGIWFSKRKDHTIDWKDLLVAALCSTPFLVYYIMNNGGVPGRFPPTFYYISGGALGVCLYRLISRGLEMLSKKSKCTEKIAEGISNVGKNSLYYLLMSNILIFAIDGSKFKMRDDVYVYCYYIIIMLIIYYIGRTKKT